MSDNTDWVVQQDPDGQWWGESYGDWFKHDHCNVYSHPSGRRVTLDERKMAVLKLATPENDLELRGFGRRTGGDASPPTYNVDRVTMRVCNI